MGIDFCRIAAKGLLVPAVGFHVRRIYLIIYVNYISNIDLGRHLMISQSVTNGSNRKVPGDWKSGKGNN